VVVAGEDTANQRFSSVEGWEDVASDFESVYEAARDILAGAARAASRAGEHVSRKAAAVANR
jgi:hypothetical protein